MFVITPDLVKMTEAKLDVHMNKNESQAKKLFVFFFGFMLACIS